METVTLSNTQPISELGALHATRRFLATRVPASLGAYQSDHATKGTLSDDVHAQLTRLCDELARYTGENNPTTASIEASSSGKKMKRARTDSERGGSKSAQRASIEEDAVEAPAKPKEKKHKKHKEKNDEEDNS